MYKLAQRSITWRTQVACLDTTQGTLQPAGSSGGHSPHDAAVCEATRESVSRPVLMVAAPSRLLRNWRHAGSRRTPHWRGVGGYYPEIQGRRPRTDSH